MLLRTKSRVLRLPLVLLVDVHGVRYVGVSSEVLSGTWPDERGILLTVLWVMLHVSDLDEP